MTIFFDSDACSYRDVISPQTPSTAGKYRQLETNPARPRQPCGTPAAARRHHKRGEPLDDACREAFRRYHREYRRAARHVDAFRRREIAARARWEQRVSADPARRERRRRQRRQSAKVRQASYIDQVAIERRLAGDTTITLTSAERRAAFDSLRTGGHSVTAASRILAVSGASAQRYEARRCSVSVLEPRDTAVTDHLEETG